MDGPSHQPAVAVLGGSGEHRWPGLEPLYDQAQVIEVSGPEGLEEALGRARVLLLTDGATPRLREVWDRARRLEWIHTTTAGVDALLFPELIRSDVILTNARGIFDRPIAEYVLGLVLLFDKDLHGTLRAQQERRWHHRETQRLEGKRALIVGTGPIGRQIGRLLRAAGLQVAGVGRRARSDDPDFGRVHAAEQLHALLPEADHVVIAAPLTGRTRGLFDAGALRRMRPTARLINIGRGPIVRTDDLVEALREGWIAGAALDVFETEPLPADHPLWTMEQVVVSPHMAGDVVGWREALSAQFLENFERWRRGEPLRNVVDKELGYVPVGPQES